MKTAYKVDLSRQQAECTLNYARLLKLLPDIETQLRWSIALDSGEMIIERLECAPYTTTLRVRQENSVLESVSQASEALVLTVRLYHDADMAEVVAWHRHRPLQPKYSYPNSAMYHEDEKAQLNQFLGDWLQHGLRCGRATETVLVG